MCNITQNVLHHFKVQICKISQKSKMHTPRYRNKSRSHSVIEISDQSNYFIVSTWVTWHMLTNHIAVFHIREITLHWNKVYYCKYLSHVTCVNQSYCIISHKSNYSTLNKVLWLYIESHVTCVSQSECIISF